MGGYVSIFLVSSVRNQFSLNDMNIRYKTAHTLSETGGKHPFV